ncbi:hypothetical protein [Eisenbergiella tayi]|uniref:hypothetical protein n=1 Tax=Eisenbergiella tayi TaxID=1432052 RepID=UPI0008490AFC|nr:hypothetical protein [Eisenbergiella tayi]ODR28289.1 hypothetical protein BEI60_31150 [Eisenbergiella tayi]
MNGTRNLRLDLSGAWKVKIATEQNWLDVILPGSLDENEIGMELKPGEYGNRKFLYLGTAVFKKEIEIPLAWKNKKLFLYLERSRVTKVIVDGEEIGSNATLVCSQIYDLSEFLDPGKHMLEIEVSNTGSIMDWDSIKYSHIASESVQTNWLGIIGQIYIEAKSNMHIGNVRIDTNNHSAVFRAKVVNSLMQIQEVYVNVLVKLGTEIYSVNEFATINNNDTYVDIVVPMENQHFWSEFHPDLYSVSLQLLDNKGNELDLWQSSFGIRDFSVSGKKFSINGNVTFMRGKHDAGVFPLTGYASMNESDWIRNFSIAKEYGINFYRFHSWCPPEAAFSAADKVGIYLQPELPLWNPSTAFEDDEEWNYYRNEAFHILTEYGNHPSFVMMAWGNELNGSYERMYQLVQECQAKDNRHLYTIGSNNNFCAVVEPEKSDYWTTFWTKGVWDTKVAGFGGANIRASTPHPTRGHINNEPPCTTRNYDREIREVSLPVMSHEVGQYQIIPDFTEIEKYKGVLFPAELMNYRKLMEEKGLLPMAESFHQASGQLAALCYREDIESALRTADFAGFQLLDLQDYNGRGSGCALIGMLDSFMDSKGIISPGKWRQFCNHTVLLIQFPKYIFRSGETMKAEIFCANYSEYHVEDELILELKDEKNKTVWSHILSGLNAPKGKLTKLAKINVPLINDDIGRKFTISALFKNSEIKTEHNIWVFPEVCRVELPYNIYVTRTWGDKTKKLLQEGKTVFLMPYQEDIIGIKGIFSTDFWNYEGFQKYNPPGTMGISLDPKHKALAGFPTDTHSEWLWWNIIHNSVAFQADNTENKFSPIITVMDNMNRQLVLAMALEAQVERGKLFLCGIDFLCQLDRPEAVALFQSFLNYTASSEFVPQKTIGIEDIDKLVCWHYENLGIDERPVG